MQLQRAINETTAEYTLKGISESIRWFTNERTINNVLDMLDEAIKANNHEVLIYACNEINAWYVLNINSIKRIAGGHIFTANYTNMVRLPGLIEDIEQHSNWRFGANRQLVSNGVTHSKEKQLLISHSTADRESVHGFVDLLRVIGLTEEQVVCSSYPGYDIPRGEDVYSYLKSCFVDHELFVLFLISKDHYYNSAPCLNEMGAAWVMGTKCVPILLPGMRPSDMRGAIGSNTLAVVLDEQDAGYALTSLRDQLMGFFGLDSVSENVWEQARDSFIRKVLKMGDDQIGD